MRARRRIKTLDITIDAKLRRKIENSSANKNQREAMRKDFRLIEAALAADKIITSLDEAVRLLFDATATSVAELKRVAWINPDIVEEEYTLWLQGGAKHERKRLLGYRLGTS